MKLFVFDMDGTLIDSGDMITNTINHVRVNLGLPKMDKYIMLQNLNNPNINSAEFFYGTKEFTDEQTKLFEDYYNESCIRDIKLYEGIKELLDELSSLNHKLAIATNSSARFAYKMLKHLNILHHFEMLVGYDDVKEPKPHPEMIHKILDSFDIDKSKTILIGDSHKDTKAAQSAGINYILVNWGFSDHKIEDNAISSIEELRKIIL